MNRCPELQAPSTPPLCCSPRLGSAVGVPPVTLAHCSTVRARHSSARRRTPEALPIALLDGASFVLLTGQEHPLQLSFSSLTSLLKTLLFIFLVSFPVLI